MQPRMDTSRRERAEAVRTLPQPLLEYAETETVKCLQG